ncbi:MAG: DUF4176 domain-containing protein [Mycoplasmatales bacterium]
MNMLVISIMSKQKIGDNDIKKVEVIIKDTYNNISLKNNVYKYEDEYFYNLDIDIEGILFIHSFNNEKIKLSKMLIKIFNIFDFFVEILVGYQDTSDYIEVYQKNRYKGLTSSGIVVTKEDLERRDLFYKKDKVNIYFDNMVERFGKYYNDYIYPMGTVLRLKDNSRSDKLSEYSYMITDRFVLKDESSKEYYEYKANIYPIGSLPNGKGIMFNNEDVKIVEFIGYETAMDRKIVEDVKKKLEEKNISKIKIDSSSTRKWVFIKKFTIIIRLKMIKNISNRVIHFN